MAWTSEDEKLLAELAGEVTTERSGSERSEVPRTRVKDSQKAQRELGRLKEQLRTAEAELQEASKREQAQQELNRLTVELQTTEAGLYKAALKREQDAQRELSAERVAFQEARQELSRLREQLQVAEEQLRQEPPVADPLDPLDRRDEDAHRELAAEYETFQQAQQELFHLGAELQRAEAGLWHQRAELEEEMQKMQSDRPAKQLQTSPSNKQKLHGQHEELRQLRLLQEEVRKQEEVAKSQEAQRSFWQERSEEQDREIEKFRSELQSLKAEKARSRNGADGAVGLEEQLESERKRESVEQVNIQSFEDQRSQQFAEKDGDEDELSSKEFSTMACLSRFKGQLAAKGVSDLDALTKIFAAYDTQKEQESITQIGFVCAMQQGGFLLSKSEVDDMFTHLAGELHGQVWRLPYEYLQSCMDDVSCPLPEVQWATGLIRSADEAARLQGKSLEMLFGQLEMESVSQLDVQAILSRYIKVGSEWRKLLPLIDKNPDGTVPWKSMLTWAGLGRQSPCPEASAPPSAADREAVQSGREVLAMQITIRELRGEVEAQERCMEELQELQQQIQGMSAAEAHQELPMHSRLAQFEMNQLQEMQEVKHHLHEELAERERQNRVDLARHAELQKDSKSREETLESTAAELEKELKFWQRRSDEDLEELLQLQSEMKSLKDAEALAAADWEKTLHMNLRQQQMEAHEDLRQVRDELQKAIEALHFEQEKSEEKQKAGERELLALRSSFQQEMTRAETELQVSFVQERGRLDALLNAESDCAQQLEASRLREKYLEEELRGKCELCREAADALRENLMELEKQVELNEERREGEAQLASRVEQLEKQRREWKKTTKALENQEQDLRRAAEQHQTSPVNKRTLRVQLEQLQEQFQKELAEKGEEHERELEAAKEAEEKLEGMRLKQLQLEEQLEEQHAEQLIDLEQRSAHQRSEEQQQELLELRSELESLRDAQAGATFISVNADQAQEAIEMLTHELHSAQDSLLRERRQHATMWASGKQQDFGEEVLAARALVQEELQCYNSSRIAQQAKFEAELAEKDKQHQKDCEELKEVHKSELQATKQEEKLRPETEEMTRVRDELRQLEEQRVAQEEARQEEEQNNQRLAAEFQQQLSEWQQRSGRQTAELEEYLTEMESCRRSEEQNISKLEEFQREMDSCQREAVDCQRRIEDLERHEEDEVKVREEAQREQREQISAELRLAALLRTELEDQRSDWQQKSDEQSKELVELQSEMQSFKAAKEAVTACCEQLVKESQQELEDRCRVERRAREDWRNQRCSLLGQLRQSSEKHLLEKKLACSERDLWEECQVQNQMLNGGLRRTLEEQQEEALALHHAVQAKERELLEMKLHRQEFSGEEEHLKEQLQQSEMRCKMQREEAEEWKEESRRFEKELLHQRSSCVQGGQELQQEFLMERRKLLEKVAQGESAQEQAFQAERLRAIRAEERCQVQETLHQAELARLTARYEKALLRCSSEQARLLSRYEKEKEEWAADWKEVNDIMQPLIQTHEAAEVQRVTRQAAAQEGLNLLKQFAQLKELETQELKRGRQASEVMAVRLDAERTESRAESGAESAEDHQEQTCEGAELRGPGGPSAQ